MSFLQPYILFGLPLILLPIIIHFINRLRHRPQPWGAMRFLLSANRASMSHAKLRQWLVLLFRVLAVLALILFVARPLAGGWLGWMLSPAPDAVLILLDRSASMETRMPNSTTSKRQQAITLLAEAAETYSSSHLVLIDSAQRVPQQIASPAALQQATLTGPTDTAADLPAMLATAFNWIVDQNAGTAEIWIASDLQRSNWHPQDARWRSLIEKFNALPQKVRFRVLALSTPAQANTRITLQNLLRRSGGTTDELQLTLDLLRTQVEPEQMPVTISVDGSQYQLEVPLDSQTLRWRHSISISTNSTRGWGTVQIAADANPRDNQAYFVYGEKRALKALVVATDDQSRPLLSLASAPLQDATSAPAEALAPADFSPEQLSDKTLLIWQAPLPDAPSSEAILEFAEQGGAVIFFPPLNPSPSRIEGTGWVESQDSDETGWTIARWDEDQGPLANSQEGFSLPVQSLSVFRRQALANPHTVLAAFADGAPFLTRQIVGRGQIYFCTTLPNPTWSNLAQGPVLVPMLQRLLESGTERLQLSSMATLGQLDVAAAAQSWDSLVPAENLDPQLHSGVYQSGNQYLALNRPPVEDEAELIAPDEAQALFSPMPAQLFQQQNTTTGNLQGEIWRLILIAMLLFLIIEGLLILPPKPAAAPNSMARPKTAAA